MRMRAVTVAMSALLLGVSVSWASGPVGIYGIVEKVVFEPDETDAERIQVWGAFAYVDGGPSGGGFALSEPARGYLYFMLPPTEVRTVNRTNIRREWNDIKSIAGTGQAIGFGRWGYIGRFNALRPADAPGNVPYILAVSERGNSRAALTVRSGATPPANPAIYQTDAGIVKLTEASHAPVITLLRETLRK
jgi:hypothetical protein